MLPSRDLMLLERVLRTKADGRGIRPDSRTVQGQVRPGVSGQAFCYSGCVAKLLQLLQRLKVTSDGGSAPVRLALHWNILQSSAVLKALSTSMLSLLIVATLLWGGCISCPQVLHVPNRKEGREELLPEERAVRTTFKERTRPRLQADAS